MFARGQHVGTVNFAIWHCLKIWPFLTFDPSTVGRKKRSLWTLLHLCPRPTCWHHYFCHLTLIKNLTFFWPLTPKPLVGRKGHRGNSCMFVQGQHVGTSSFRIWRLKFDLRIGMGLFWQIWPFDPLNDLWSRWKEIHMYTGKMHCSHLNWEILLSLVLEIKIQEVF